MTCQHGPYRLKNTSGKQLQLRRNGKITLLPADCFVVIHGADQALRAHFPVRAKAQLSCDNCGFPFGAQRRGLWGGYSDIDFLGLGQGESGWEEKYDEPLRYDKPIDWLLLERPRMQAIRAVSKEIDRKLKLGWRFRNGKLVQPTLWRRFINWVSYR